MAMHASNTARPARGIGSYVAGILQGILGGILTFSFGLATLLSGIHGMDSVGGQVTFLVFFLLGLLLLLSGIGKCKLYKAGQQVRSAMMGKTRESLTLLSQITRKDYTRLVKDLRRLSAKGFFPGAVVDLNRREFVTDPSGAQPPIVQGGTVLVEKRRKSVLSIYLFGFVWLTYALTFPLYRWYDFVIAAVAALLVCVISARLLPEQVLIVEETAQVEPPRPPEKINTGDSELDEVLTAAMAHMKELTALETAITNERVAVPLRDLVYICKQIFDYVKKTPGKVRQIRQFMNYYLPTTIKLLQNYDELSREQVKGENIRETMRKIEDTILVILKAFQKELDDLYKDKAMDISVDIEVLQNMMEQEGLTGNAWQPGKVES